MNVEDVISSRDVEGDLIAVIDKARCRRVIYSMFSDDLEIYNRHKDYLSRCTKYEASVYRRNVMVACRVLTEQEIKVLMMRLDSLTRR